MSGKIKTARQYIGANDNDGKIKLALKIATPYGALSKGVTDLRAAGGRLSEMVGDLKNENREGLQFSEAVLAADMNRAVAVANAKRLRAISRALLYVLIFILTDCLIFIAFGMYMVLFSLPAVFLCFVFAGKYAFFAEALTFGEFPSGSLRTYVFNSRWWMQILMPAEGERENANPKTVIGAVKIPARTKKGG